MKLQHKGLLALAAVLAAAVAVSFYAESARAENEVTKRKLGDPAPAISVSEWVQGGPVKLDVASGKNIYVVEFWATWCPPCRQSIPHLTALYEKYKDSGLQIIAVTNEEPDVVKPFVEKQGDKMTYPVAIDGNGTMVRDYMSAFGKNGIPQAFVIDTKGKIVWEGHPMGGLDKAIEKYLPKKDAENAA